MVKQGKIFGLLATEGAWHWARRLPPQLQTGAAEEQWGSGAPSSSPRASINSLK